MYVQTGTEAGFMCTFVKTVPSTVCVPQLLPNHGSKLKTTSDQRMSEKKAPLSVHFKGIIFVDQTQCQTQR